MQATPSRSLVVRDTDGVARPSVVTLTHAHFVSTQVVALVAVVVSLGSYVSAFILPITILLVGLSAETLLSCSKYKMSNKLNNNAID